MNEKRSIKENLSYRKDILLKSTSDEQLHEHEYLFQRTEYTPEGKVSLEEHYNAAGELMQKYVYTYDEKGFVVEEKLVEEDDFVAEHKSWERDENGRIMKEYRHYMDGSADTVIFEFNTQGQIEKKTLLDPDGETENTEEFVWEGEYLVHHKITDADGELISEIKKQFNEKGLPTEVIEFEAIGPHYRKTLNQYYESGNKMEVLVYNQEEQLIEKVLLQEDEKGNIQQVTEETRQKKNELTFTYDDRGNVVFQEETDRNGEMVGRVQRQFDDNNLLLSSEVFIHGGGRGMSRNYELRQEYKFY